jgi:mannosyl-glycoprotein endo-beta-N-acetylglucosaminidase
MPLAGNPKSWANIASDPRDAPYFSSLKQLDDWSANPRKKLDAVLEYIPRPQPATPSDTGKLLVPTKP